MDLADDLVEKGVLKTPRIIKAFRDIQRADFMPEGESVFADVDEAFPIGEGQTISQPYTVAFLLELLQAQPRNSVLDVGYGSGWQSALLAHIVTNNKQVLGRVFSIERIPQLCTFGNRNISKYNFIASGVVETFCADAVTEFAAIAKKSGEFDKIIAAAALRVPQREYTESGILKRIPAAWRRYLKPGGTLVLPVNESLWVYTKQNTDTFLGTEYPGFVFVPLVSGKRRIMAPLKARSQKLVKFFRRCNSRGILLFFLFIGLSFVISSFAILLSPPGNVVFPKEIVIPQHTSAREVASILRQEGIIRSETMLLLSLMWEQGIRNIQAGTYFFEDASWVHEVAAAVTDSATRKLVTVRILEGSSLRGVAAVFEENNIFGQDDIWIFTGIPAVDYRGREMEELSHLQHLEDRFPFLAGRPLYATLEGYLIPDTYELFDNATPQEVVFKMLQNFEAKLREEGIFREIEKQGYTLHDVLTRASLIEREATLYDDKRIIAGIIENRIERDMPLQMDASLMYVTQRGSLLLTKDDLASDSPYNTYVHKGLPLGPIANPGIDSIKAVLFPEDSPYLYYLSDKNSTIHFSKTFEEHKLKKAQYLP